MPDEDYRSRGESHAPPPGRLRATKPTCHKIAYDIKYHIHERYLVQSTRATCSQAFEKAAPQQRDEKRGTSMQLGFHSLTGCHFSFQMRRSSSAVGQHCPMYFRAGALCVPQPSRLRVTTSSATCLPCASRSIVVRPAGNSLSKDASQPHPAHLANIGRIRTPPRRHRPLCRSTDIPAQFRQALLGAPLGPCCH